MKRILDRALLLTMIDKTGVREVSEGLSGVNKSSVGSEFS